MIAKPYWDYDPAVSILDNRDRAVIEIDFEMLDTIMSQLRTSIGHKFNAGRYEDALKMLQYYLKLEEMMKAWILKLKEDGDENEA